MVGREMGVGCLPLGVRKVGVGRWEDRLSPWASRTKGRDWTSPLEAEVYQQGEQQVSGCHGSSASEGVDGLSWQRRSGHQRVPGPLEAGPAAAPGGRQEGCQAPSRGGDGRAVSCGEPAVRGPGRWRSGPFIEEAAVWQAAGGF